MVKKFFSPIDAGLYSAWSLFAKIIFFLIGPLISISFIFFSNKNNRHQQNKILIMSLIALFIVGFSCYIAYVFFPLIMVNIIFGNKFRDLAPLLGLASFFGIFYSFIYLFNNYFLARKSPFALILPFTIPVYLLSLFIFKNNLLNIISVDIYFSLFVGIIYSIAYLFYKKNSITV